jgi:hypothetical protein
MADRERVVASWQAKLAFWRRRLEADRPLRPWLARMYVRVLSFLLSRYASDGDRDSSPAADGGNLLDEEPAESGSRMTFYQAPATGGGRPARSGAEIRGVLETVREHQPPRDRGGPLVEGLAPDDWIALTAFYDPAEIERLKRMLAEAGISVRVERSRRMRQALVHVADMERARPIMLEHAGEARDSSRWRRPPDRDWPMIGAVCGFGFGAGFLVLAFRYAGMAPAGAAGNLWLGLFGGMLGLLSGLAIGFFAGTIADG